MQKWHFVAIVCPGTAYGAPLDSTIGREKNSGPRSSDRAEADQVPRPRPYSRVPAALAFSDAIVSVCESPFRTPPVVGAVRAARLDGLPRGLMRRIKITIAYDGGDFHGWQVQPGLATIQGTLEAVVSEIEGKPVQVAGSGRTDAGVHALRQVGAFLLENPIPLPNLKRAMNRLLPPTVRILHLDEVAPKFHPRFDAHSKTYEYRIARDEVCSPFEWRYVHHYPYPLEEGQMAQLASIFEGTHDYGVFAAADDSDEDAKSKVRTIYSSVLERRPGRLVYRVRGSGFLKHMVRNLVGTLIEAGKGNIADLTALPQKSGPTAPAKGLFLIEVDYGNGQE